MLLPSKLVARVGLIWYETDTMAYGFSCQYSRLQTHKDLAVQFTRKTCTLKAAVVVGSFGAASPLRVPVFELSIEVDSTARPEEPPVRYHQQPEIHHTFRDEPRSPPRVISLFFTLIVVAAFPALLAAWLWQGANVSHVTTAMRTAPIAHALFLCSIFAVEAILFRYYVGWNLFQTLPVAGLAGLVAFVSGSRALTEVQGRRLAGLR